MQLSEELFAAVVGWDSISMDSGRTSERRVHGRIRMPARVQLIPMSKHVAGKPISVQVRDLSHEGIGLLMPGKWKKGESVLVRLQARDVSQWVLCEIARVEKVGENLFVVGAKFTRLVDPGKAPARIDEKVAQV